MMGKFSNAEKAQELKRELGMRRHVYPRRVADGKMQQAAADRLIALSEDMLADYEALAAKDMPDMFAPLPLVDEAQAIEDEIADRPYRDKPSHVRRTFDARGEVVQRSITNTIRPRSLAQSMDDNKRDSDLLQASRDPTYGKTPGINIESQGQRWENCKSCGESILIGQVRDVMTGTLNTRRWDAMPTEHEGKRYYSKHRCG